MTDWKSGEHMAIGPIFIIVLVLEVAQISFSTSYYNVGLLNKYFKNHIFWALS